MAPGPRPGLDHARSPDYREAYPRGITFYGLPTEIWWYGFFSITFVDEQWVEDYHLDPYGADHIAMINRAQQEWNEPRVRFSGEPPRTPSLPDLDVRIEKAEGRRCASRPFCLTPRSG